jgi:hypothetical protein
MRADKAGARACRRGRKIEPERAGRGLKSRACRSGGGVAAFGASPRPTILDRNGAPSTQPNSRTTAC